MKCKICNKQISDQLKKDVLQDKFEQLEKIALMKVLGGDLVKCPYPDCGEQNVFEPGNVDYHVKDASGTSVASGTFMPMNADDGPHYGDNIKMPGEGTYTLELTIHSPAENGYLLHSDSETGVEAGKDGTGLWSDPVVLTYDWDYVPLAK